MDEYTYIEILVEDKSGGILIEQIMEKYVAGKENITYQIRSFKGIGKIPAKINSASQIKSKRLLTDVFERNGGFSEKYAWGKGYFRSAG